MCSDREVSRFAFLSRKRSAPLCDKQLDLAYCSAPDVLFLPYNDGHLRWHCTRAVLITQLLFPARQPTASKTSSNVAPILSKAFAVRMQVFTAHASFSNQTDEDCSAMCPSGFGVPCFCPTQHGASACPRSRTRYADAKHVHPVMRIVPLVVFTLLLRTGPSAMMAPEAAPAGETAPSVADAPAPATVELVCPCALEKGSYDVTATNLADILRSRADCPLDMTAGSGCPSGNYG